MTTPENTLVHLSEPIKFTLDGTAVGTSLATFFSVITGFIPHLATLLSVVWLGIRIYETDTVQKILGKKDK